MQQFSKRLKEVRTNLNLTQAQAAQRLNMTQQAYQKIESGKAADVKISTLSNICRTFDVSANWLLDISDK